MVHTADWVLVERPSVSYSLVTVPLYDTLGPDAVRYISNHAELSAVACSVAVLPVLLQSLQSCPSIFLVASLSSWCRISVFQMPVLQTAGGGPCTEQSRCEIEFSVTLCRSCLA